MYKLIPRSLEFALYYHARRAGRLVYTTNFDGQMLWIKPN